MDDQGTPHAPPNPAPPPGAPPTVPGPIRRARSQWPNVVGVLAIIFGSLGMLMHGCGTAGLYLNLFTSQAMEQLATDIPPEQSDILTVQHDVALKYIAPATIANVLRFANAVFLLIAGIACNRRQPGTRRLLLIYAIAEMVVMTVAIGIEWAMQQEIMSALAKSLQAQQSGGIPPGMMGVMGAFGSIGVIIKLLFCAVWPVFLIIWFNRAAVVKEIATWRPARTLTEM